MTKILWIVMAIGLSAAAATAQEQYFGVGGSYAASEMEISGDLVKGDLDDTWGFNVKAGTHLNSYLSLEFNFDYLPSFEWDADLNVIEDPIGAEIDADAMTFMFALKASPDYSERKFRPFLIVGGGWMYVSADTRATVGNVRQSQSISDSGFCGEVGAGFDWYFNDSLALGLEGTYVTGFGDVEDVQYGLFTLGLTYFFFGPWFM
ncbi:MAG: porin family protein [Desulfobacterales bacterium]